MTPGPTLVLVAAAGAIVLGSCSGTTTLDTPKLEREITTGIEQQAEVTVGAVSCPDGVESRKGVTFDCTASITDGPSLTVQVDVLDDAGNVQWELVD